MTELAEIVAGWPLGASIAAAAAAHGLRLGRRRTVLNEALHELRRPLQAIALASGAGHGSAGAVRSSVRLAAAALERLECEINGGPSPPRLRTVELRPLVEATLRRWGARASLGGGRIVLRWQADEAVVEADPAELAQALDNLIVNAIEHGGPSIALEVRRQGGSVQVAVVDSGRRSRHPSRRGTPAEVIARLSGKRRRGYGLAVVRRTAAAHGGRFALRRSERGTVALLELPLGGETPLSGESGELAA
jgi:signal transduction histidine kinase